MGEGGADRGRFAWHELMTTDVAAAKTFYGTVIGWGTRKGEASGSDALSDYTVWTAGERPVGGLMKLPEQAREMGAPPHWLAYVEVPHVDATVEHAVGLGATVYLHPETAPNVGCFAVLGDPQGAAFGVLTSERPLQPETDPAPLTFSWHELYAADLASAVHFYEGLFGWKKQSEFDMGKMGIYHMFGRDRFTYGGMMKKPEDMQAPPHWLHYVLVDSADEGAERAKQNGAQVLVGPMEVPGGDRIAMLMDPQGAAFAVHAKGGKS